MKDIDTHSRLRIDALQESPSGGLVGMDMTKEEIVSERLRDFVKRASEKVDVVEGARIHGMSDT
jgi:hypothetical protein